MKQKYRKALVASAGLAVAFLVLLATLPQAYAQDSGTPPTSQIGEQPGDAPAGQANAPANQPVPQNGEIGPQTYTQDETMAAAKNFFGGNASKVFTLVYNLHWTRDLFQRFPGVDGSLYIVAGVGLNYQRANNITLAPIRTGVGLRAGANVGYLSYSEKKTWIPF